MPTDPAGNYTLPPVYFAQPGTTIRAEQHNSPLEDLAQGVSGRLMRDGRNGMVGNLDMGSFRITNLAPGTDVSDAATVGQGVPIGSVMDYAGANAPEGWLLCYGQAVSRTTYADLYAVIGVQYGNGNGSTTFNVPDLRGRVVAGLDNMGGSNASRLTSMASLFRGQTGGSAEHTLTVAQMPSHSHGGSTGSGGSHTHSGTAQSAGSDHTHPVSGTTGSSGSHSHTLETAAGQGSASHPGRSDGREPISTRNTSIDGAHTHPISGTATGGSHAHTLSISAVGSHTHGISSQGSGNAHNNTQPTMVLNKIIRASF